MNLIVFLTLSLLQLHFKISRKRRHFGSPYSFSDYMVTDHPEAYAEVAPQQNPNFELQRLENDVAVQVHINILNFYPSLHMPKHALG